MYEKIGQLYGGAGFLSQKVWAMNRSARPLVDHGDPVLPVTAQCRLPRVARSTLYYQPVAASADDLAVMRRIDELHLAYPFYG